MSSKLNTAKDCRETGAWDRAETCNRVGAALGEKGDLEGAVHMFQQALDLAPDWATAWNNMGAALKGLGRVSWAIRCFRQAILCDPGYGEAHWNLSFLLLLVGAFEEGWKEYEWRFRKKAWSDALREDPGLPRWDGTLFRGKRLLAVGEQGFGDEIQFVRYLRLVKDLGGTVVLETQHPLTPLFRSLPWIDGLRERSGDPGSEGPFDLWIPLMSLPGIFQTNLETIPACAQVPYLYADPQKAATWRRRLLGNRFKVGLVWEGKATDPNRACPLRLLAPLAQLDGVMVYGLQKGEAGKQAKDLPESATIVNMGDMLHDFSDTAALMENLDLMVSVDTATAHLSGAMGKKTFTLLPFAPDWRWLLGREDSPWYPTMRLFRQEVRGEWEAPVDRLIRAVRNLAEAWPGREIVRVRSEENDAPLVPRDLFRDPRQVMAEAVRLHRSGRLHEALFSYSKAVQMKPDMAEAYCLMGDACRQMGSLQKALSCYQKALSLKPDHIEACHNAGLALKDLGRFGDAAACWRKALRIRPDVPEFHYNLGNAYKEAGRFCEAASCYQRAIDLKGDMVEAHFNMANALKESGALSDAISRYEAVLAMAPRHVEALNNMGLAYRDNQEVKKAIDVFQRALRLDPGHVEIRWNRALALLLCGRYHEGWKEYEVRFQRNDLATTYPRRLDRPRWDGSFLRGQTILVHHEQGLGDTIQFVRYLPMVKARGGRVLLEVHESLAKLCRTVAGVDEVFSCPLDQEIDRPFDCCVPLMSLPRIFRTTLCDIPADIPYIRPDPDMAAMWGERLTGPRLKVGLVWSGNPRHKDDRNRSCPLKAFGPLARIPGVQIYALQKQGREGAEEELQNLGIVNLGKELDDFSVTAGILANLDLIISVDTAVAHLSGAMGRPVWILLPFVPDWRWLLKGEYTPWYPTARLFRQRRRGDWEEVVQRTAETLRTLAVRRSGQRVRSQGGDKIAKAGPSGMVQAEDLVADAAVLFQEGRPQEALALCRKALRTDGRHAGALHLKGLIHRQAGEYDEAVRLISRAVEIDPSQPVFHNSLGAACQERGDVKGAIAHYQDAIRLKPDFAEACYNLGKAWSRARQFQEALLWFQRAVDVRPDYTEVYPKMGAALLELGRPEEAIAWAERLLALSPDCADGHYMMGNGLKEKDQFEGAVRCYQTALKLDPGHVQSLVHMGIAYQSVGQMEAAAEAFDRAVAMAPSYPEARLNRALLCLLMGNYAEGWKEYERRLETDGWRRLHPGRPRHPRWDGSALESGTLLVHHEQGLGDALQFVRYLPLLRVGDARLVFEADRRLLRLLRGLIGAEGIIMKAVGASRGQETTCEMPLMSLPGLLGTTLDTVPSNIPYLRPEPDRVHFWGRRLRRMEGFRIGISWQGNPAYSHDRHRSIPLIHFRDLAGMEGVTLVSLQKRHGTDQAAQLKDKVPMADLGPGVDQGPDAFVDTAGIMASLDLVISSDTAIPHLAGALGTPAWVALCHIPDWRWGLSGETTPWYPGMRLFRQTRLNDWKGVFDRICRAVQKRMGLNVR